MGIEETWFEVTWFLNMGKNKCYYSGTNNTWRNKNLEIKTLCCAVFHKMLWITTTPNNNNNNNSSRSRSSNNDKVVYLHIRHRLVFNFSDPAGKLEGVERFITVGWRGRDATQQQCDARAAKSVTQNLSQQWVVVRNNPANDFVTKNEDSILHRYTKKLGQFRKQIIYIW